MPKFPKATLRRVLRSCEGGVRLAKHSEVLVRPISNDSTIAPFEFILFSWKVFMNYSMFLRKLGQEASLLALSRGSKCVEAADISAAAPGVLKQFRIWPRTPTCQMKCCCLLVSHFQHCQRSHFNFLPITIANQVRYPALRPMFLCALKAPASCAKPLCSFQTAAGDNYSSWRCSF